MPDVGQLLVKNDTGRKLQVTLLDNGTAVNLTGATVKLHYRMAGGPMSRLDYRATESQVDQFPLRSVVKALLSVMLWLHNNSDVSVTRQQLFSKFKELMR